MDRETSIGFDRLQVIKKRLRPLNPNEDCDDTIHWLVRQVEVLRSDLAAAVEAKASSDAAYARLMETAAGYRAERDAALKRFEEELVLAQEHCCGQIKHDLKADIQAYRGALGYPVPGDHNGFLSDGTMPINGMAEALRAEVDSLSKSLELVRSCRDWNKAQLARAEELLIRIAPNGYTKVIEEYFAAKEGK